MPAIPSKMPRYDVRNDGAGPYAIFYCDVCSREYRSQPDVANTLASDIGRQAMGGLLRNIPLVGNVVANNVVGQDPRTIQNLNPQQLQNAWNQLQDRFRECPTCHRIVCMSDFDETTGFCQEHTPRTNEIAQARAEQAGHMVKGFAAAFGLDQAFQSVGQAAKAAQAATAQMARCPTDGTLAAPGTKFCPECGAQMVQPQAQACPKCGQPTGGAKFCPNCGTKVEQAPAPTGLCPQCGAKTQGAKFCPECGAKQA
jgi:hypothetical protein